MNSNLFHQVEPSLENYWRSIILFGRNVASYKFALAKTLLEFRDRPTEIITLEELALPFAKHICQHLRTNPKQATSASSQFLQACTKFNTGDLSENALRSTTVRLGFNNVIDAFHVVNQAAIGPRFYIDQRAQGNRIRLTDEFRRLTTKPQSRNFEPETEARWRLVETAWELGISSRLLEIHYDDNLSTLYAIRSQRRIDVTSCRDSISGYQKGRCFYYYRDITIQSGAIDLADVDHFIPWMLHAHLPEVNGVWNLVLACRECNRGEAGKMARVPSIALLERLHARNEYFVASHHPLRETILSQTGQTITERVSFLNTVREKAKLTLIHEWEPQSRGIATF